MRQFIYILKTRGIIPLIWYAWLVGMDGIIKYSYSLFHTCTYFKNKSMNKTKRNQWLSSKIYKLQALTWNNDIVKWSPIALYFQMFCLVHHELQSKIEGTTYIYSSLIRWGKGLMEHFRIDKCYEYTIENTHSHGGWRSSN